MINQYVLNYNLAFYFCVLGKSNFFVHICKLCDWFTTVHVYIYTHSYIPALNVPIKALQLGQVCFTSLKKIKYKFSFFHAKYFYIIVA